MLDFFISGEISSYYINIDSCSDSTSDHSSTIAIVVVIDKELEYCLYNKKTDLNFFSYWIAINLTLQ